MYENRTLLRGDNLDEISMFRLVVSAIDFANTQTHTPQSWQPFGIRTEKISLEKTNGFYGNQPTATHKQRDPRLHRIQRICYTHHPIEKNYLFCVQPRPQTPFFSTRDTEKVSDYQG